MPGRQEWPELVGVKVSVAALIIKRENAKLEPTVLLAGSPVTLDYRPYRVRIVKNIEDVVVGIPRTG